MRVLIWLGCILVYSIIVTALRSAGIILGGIPTAVLALVVVFLPAPALCKLWSRRKEKRVAVPPEKWYTCQRCGQLVREGDECDCSEAEERQKAEELGMTIERYRAFREDIESNVTEKHFRDATKKAERHFPWRAVFAAVVAVLVVSFFVVMLVPRAEPEVCPRCSMEADLSETCPCCYSPICESCAADLKPKGSVASDFLREKAEERAKEVDEQYGPGAYGGTQWLEEQRSNN